MGCVHLHMMWFWHTFRVIMKIYSGLRTFWSLIPGSGFLCSSLKISVPPFSVDKYKRPFFTVIELNNNWTGVGKHLYGRVWMHVYMHLQFINNYDFQFTIELIYSSLFRYDFMSFYYVEFQILLYIFVLE